MGLCAKRNIVIIQLIIDGHMQKVHAFNEIKHSHSVGCLVFGSHEFTFILLGNRDHPLAKFQIDLMHVSDQLTQIVDVVKHFYIILIYPETETTLINQNLWYFDFVAHV